MGGETIGWVDNRQYTRIETDLACWIEGRAEGRIRNLSLGGALMVGPAGAIPPRGPLSLELRVGNGPLLQLTARVCRRATQCARTTVGIEFLELTGEEHDRLGALLGELARGRGTGKRETPRLYRRVALRCPGHQEFYARMNDISPGGVGLQCEHPQEVGTRVVLEILAGPDGEGVHQPAVVKNVRALGGGFHRLGLQFEPGTPEQRARLQALLTWFLMVPSR